MNNECVFCKIADRRIPSDIVYDGEKVLVFRDLKPQAPIHFLAIPKKHISSLNDIGKSDMPLMADMMEAVKDVAERYKIGADGYRVVVNCNENGGQEVFHLHFHILGGRRMTWPPG
ncbi:MAG: histidine triad nucleotide-binding protein [Candidatus Omnitrophica bacterium]|nr:histidine triad nucleotide-binding protein [Candidatus Omnitrophota bacterium]